MSQEKKTKKETMAELKERYPYAAKITVDYAGAGDSFDSFFEFTIEDSKEAVIEPGQHDENDFYAIAETYIWDIMNRAQHSPDFNNDGSEGRVIFDLINKVVILEVTYLEDVTPDYDGDEDADDYDQKRDEYWDNMDERDWEYHVQKPEEF
jgi:hypothetical protein